MHGATGNLYAGLHEWPDMAFVLHLLRPDDLMLDIGSNVGSYTVITAAVVGARCIACEPNPHALRFLRANVAINQIYHQVTTVNACVGSASTRVNFSADQGPMNRVVTGDYPGLATIVPMVTVDSLPDSARAFCWKVDVEGFEAEVLRGGIAALAGPAVRALLLENRSQEVSAMMRELRFIPCDYDPWSRHLQSWQSSSCANQLWIRDLRWARRRLRTAPAFHLLDMNI
ncbi:FkbM family methyltransferase [Synechococcus sp. CS-1328]|uniref:FkbM family methyltransferase n=1 Tax=Synechococcus sp. CS-1328 TaxID=2847976 RepID=UPI00223A8075|nr:FkbM family methyltransferase [Synechococcus sp. CS-1328]MCT0225921.1 FkbM family methyltransferase [Synechococcus sp. CS-1328]